MWGNRQVALKAWNHSWVWMLWYKTAHFRQPGLTRCDSLDIESAFEPAFSLKFSSLRAESSATEGIPLTFSRRIGGLAAPLVLLAATESSAQRPRFASPIQPNSPFYTVQNPGAVLNGNIQPELP